MLDIGKRFKELTISHAHNCCNSCNQTKNYCDIKAYVRYSSLLLGWGKFAPSGVVEHRINVGFPQPQIIKFAQHGEQAGVQNVCQHITHVSWPGHRLLKTNTKQLNGIQTQKFSYRNFSQSCAQELQVKIGYFGIMHEHKHVKSVDVFPCLVECRWCCHIPFNQQDLWHFESDFKTREEGLHINSAAPKC